MRTILEEVQGLWKNARDYQSEPNVSLTTRSPQASVALHKMRNALHMEVIGKMPMRLSVSAIL